MKPWFRHYVGMTRDDRLIEAAMRSKQPLDRVVFVWCCILESASECDEGGAYLVAPETIAYQLRVPPARIRAVFDALSASDRIADGRVIQWSSRQFESDQSAARMRRHRENKRRHGDDGPPNGDVTECHGDVTVTDQSRAEQNRAEAGKPASALSREPASLPSIEDQEFEAACRHAVVGWEPPKGSFKPMLALGGDREEIAGILREVATSGRSPVGSWKLWAEDIVPERRAARKAPPRPAARASPPAAAVDDSPRVNTPSGPRSLAFLRAEHAAGRWSKLYGPLPGQPGCPIAEPALEPTA